MRRPFAAACAAFFFLACSAPPQKEIDRAQGAIDAARAAGAERYAPEPFKAAAAAMQQTHEAVQQRDYRLALSRAIDANDRALEAATQAANGKARARADAEVALSYVTTAIRQMDLLLKSAESARVPARDLDAARQARAAADGAVQEARAAIEQEDYPGATAKVKAVSDQIAAANAALGTAINARTARAPRRR